MNSWPTWQCPAATAATLAWLMLGVLPAAEAGSLTPALERSLARRGTHADVAVIVRMTDPVDFQAYAVGDRRQRNSRLVLALKARAVQNGHRVQPELLKLGATDLKDLWLINALAVTLPAFTLASVATLPGVESVDMDAFVQGGRSQRTPPPRTTAGEILPSLTHPPQAAAPVPQLDLEHAQPPWNLRAMHAPELWAQGHAGQGVVVATMDTGVDAEHPDLRGKWRAGSNSWFDPHGEAPLPYDAMGHGTQALAVIVGGPTLGVAPQARWIAVRLFDNNGRASMSDIHRGFQWLMDPDGDPATADAPDVVNASWALAGRAGGACILEFSEDIRALKSAGIAVVFAAGNDGPRPNTSNSPGNNPGVMSVGAIDQDNGLARETSRGPSSCDHSVFPRLLAPGVNIRTADVSHGGLPSYTTVSGSSLAAPHVAGALALLAGAFPSASVAELEAALLEGGRPLPGQSNLLSLDAKAAFEILSASHAAERVQARAVASQRAIGMEKTP